MIESLKGIVEDEVEKTDRLIIAAEKWSKSYSKDPNSHAQLIKNEARMTRILRKYFRDKAEIIDSFVSWPAYFGQITADFDVKAIVSGDFFDGFDSDFIAIAFDTVALSIATGAQAGEAIYKRPLGIRSSDAIIQDLTTERLAFLAGKKIDKDGKIIDNPKAEYKLSDKTRADVAKSIQTSISLGEDKRAAISRLRTVIDNPARAELIAQTETVNAYGQGMLQFGSESNATGKEWEDVAATDECRDNADQGIIGINDDFISGDAAPAAHSGCRCNLRIVYANEFNPDGS